MDCLVKDMKVKSLQGNLPALPANKVSAAIDFSWSIPKGLGSQDHASAEATQNCGSASRLLSLLGTTIAILVLVLSAPRGSHCHPRGHHLGQAFISSLCGDHWGEKR